MVEGPLHPAGACDEEEAVAVCTCLAVVVGSGNAVVEAVDAAVEVAAAAVDDVPAVVETATGAAICTCALNGAASTPTRPAEAFGEACGGTSPVDPARHAPAINAALSARRIVS